MNSFDPQLLQKLPAHALSVLAEQEDQPAPTSTSSEVAPAAVAQPLVPQTVGDMKSTAFAAQARGIKPNVFISVGSATYKVEAVSEEFVTARLWVKGEAGDVAQLRMADAMKARILRSVQTRFGEFSAPWEGDVGAMWVHTIARGIATASILHVARAQPSLDGKLQLLTGPNAVLAARTMKAGTLKIHWLCQLALSCMYKCKCHLSQSRDGAGMMPMQCCIVRLRMCVDPTCSLHEYSPQKP